MAAAALAVQPAAEKSARITAKNITDSEYFYGHKACAGCGYCLARCPEKKFAWDWI